MAAQNRPSAAAPHRMRLPQSDAYNALRFGNTTTTHKSPPLQTNLSTFTMAVANKRPQISRKQSVEFAATTPPSPVAPRSPKHRVPQIQITRACGAKVSTRQRTPSSSAESTSSSDSPAIWRIRSILKGGDYKIYSAKTAEDGKKKNAGDRRHSTTLYDFDEPMTAATVNSTLSNHSFRTLVSDYQEIICNSLLSAAYTPRSCSSATSSDPITSGKTAYNAPRAPIKLREVERAYAQIQSRMRAWAQRTMRGLDSDEAAFPHDNSSITAMFSTSREQQDVATAVNVIAKGIERDLRAFIENANDADRPKQSPILSSGSPNLSSSPILGKGQHFQPYSTFQNKENLRPLLCESPASSSSPSVTFPTKRGKNEDQLNYSRQRTDLAQSAIKCLGVIFYYPCYFKLLSIEQSRTLLSQVLEIPTIRSCRDPRDKEIVAFALWIIATLRLPHHLVDDAKDGILIAIQSVLNPPDNARAKLFEKTRSATLQALAAFSTITRLYPTLFTFAYCRPDAEQGEVTYSVFELSLAGPLSLRTRALTALGSLTNGIRRHQHWRDQSPEGMELFQQQIRAFSKFALGFYTYNQNNRLHALRDALMQAAVKGDESWVLNYVALLPALLGPKFIRLEEEGPVLYINLIHLCLTQVGQDVASMAFLSWRHLIFAILSSTRPRDNCHLIFGLREKPAQLLLQIIAAKEQKIKPIHYLPITDGISHAAQAYLDLLFGYTVAINKAKLSEESLLANFDRLWSDLMLPVADIMLNSPHKQDHDTFFAAIAKILDQKTKADLPLSRLLSQTILSGKMASQISVEPIRELCSVVQKEAILVSDVPSWPSLWLQQNMFKVFMILLENTAKQSTKPRENSDSQATVESLRPSDVSEATTLAWKAFVGRLCSESVQDWSRPELFRWLEENSRTLPSSLSTAFTLEMINKLVGECAYASDVTENLQATLSSLQHFAEVQAAQLSLRAIGTESCHAGEVFRAFSNATVRFFGKNAPDALVEMSAGLLLDGMNLMLRHFSAANEIAMSNEACFSVVAILGMLASKSNEKQNIRILLDQIVEQAKKLSSDNRLAMCQQFLKLEAAQHWESLQLEIAVNLQHSANLCPETWNRLKALNAKCFERQSYQQMELLISYLVENLRSDSSQSSLATLVQLADLAAPWLADARSSSCEREKLLELYYAILSLLQTRIQSPNMDSLKNYATFLVAPFQVSPPSVAALAALARFWLAVAGSTCGLSTIPLKIGSVLVVASKILGQQLFDEDEQDTCTKALLDERPIESLKTSVQKKAVAASPKSKPSAANPQNASSQSSPLPPFSQLVVRSSQTSASQCSQPSLPLKRTKRKECTRPSTSSRTETPSKKRKAVEESVEPASQSLRVISRADLEVSRCKETKQRQEKPRKKQRIVYTEIDSDSSEDELALASQSSLKAGIFDCVEITLSADLFVAPTKKLAGLKRSRSENDVEPLKKQRILTDAIHNYVVSRKPQQSGQRQEHLIIKHKKTGAEKGVK